MLLAVSEAGERRPRDPEITNAALLMIANLVMELIRRQDEAAPRAREFTPWEPPAA
jgi:hypothetical protein